MNSMESKLVALLLQAGDLGLEARVSLEEVETVEVDDELESLRGLFSIRKSGSE